jgi:hypothetical protein
MQGARWRWSAMVLVNLDHVPLRLVKRGIVT